MVKYAFVAMAGLAAALPLNINLGAYSPALVVGDGEISFGGRQDVSTLMNALEGAAVNAAAGAGAVAAPAVIPAAAEGVAPVTQAAASADPALQEQVQQVSALQGMGKKEIAPREETKAPVKRDITGFDRALRYAEAALVKGPKVQLGTGAEGSGVGIIVDNNQEAASRAGTGVGEGSGAAPAKRDLPAAPKQVRAKVTTMYIRNGVPASLQPSSNVVPRDVATGALPATAVVDLTKRDSNEAIDAINLNVDGSEGVTMTFVETVLDDDEE